MFDATPVYINQLIVVPVCDKSQMKEKTQNNLSMESEKIKLLMIRNSKNYFFLLLPLNKILTKIEKLKKSNGNLSFASLCSGGGPFFGTLDNTLKLSTIFSSFSFI